MVAVLADIRTLGQGILSAAQGGALDSIVPADLSAQYRTALAHHNPPHDDRYPRGRRFKEKPPLAVSTAVAVTAALSVVGCASIGAAAEALAELYARVDRHTLEQAVAHNGKVSGSASPVLQAVYAASLGARLTTVEQLHRRLGSAFPGPPIDDSARPKRLTRYTPTLLWPSWSLRLCPPSSFQRSARPALSVAVLLVHTTMGVEDAGGRLGGVTTHGSVVTLLGNLKQSGHWDDIRAALIRLADYLDVDGAPIDYQRRRRLEYTDLLPDTLWRTLARDTFTRPEGAATARDFLRERLSGSPVIPTPVPSYDYQDYDALLRFPVRLNPELLAALDDHAREFLAAQRVTDEPIWWEPPTELLHDLRLPGPDIEAIDTAELHRLLRREQLDLGEAAARIGVSADAARCALESHPAHRDRKPAPKPKIGPRHPSPAYLQASSMFPRDRFVELYEHQHLSLRDLAAIAGVSKPTITELARDYAIAIRDGRPTPRYVIDREWLYTEHVTNGRSLSDLARELGVSVMTVSKWAKIHHIPVRGLAWRTADTLRANDTLPPLGPA